MGLFKNKVGRPSNEIKYIRKVFVISVIAIVLSVVSLIISCLLLNGSIGNKILGKAKSGDITIKMLPDSNEQYTVVKDGIFTIDYYNLKKTGTKNVNITISNKNDNDSVWYGWFTYNKSVNKNNMTWGGTSNQRKCAEIESNGEFKGTKTMKLDSSGDDAVRIGRIKVYESKADCKADNDGNATSLKELTIKYKYDSSSSSTTDADTKKAISLLEWIINFFKSLFSEKDDKPSTGDSEQTTTTKASLKLTCPVEAQVNTEFTCTTDQAGVTISVTKENLAKGYNETFTTTSSDLTKQSKYTKAGTVYISASKSGYATKTLAVSIKNATTTKKTTTTTAKKTTASNATVNTIISKIGGEDHYCNKTNGNFNLPSTSNLFVQIAYSQIGYKEKASNSSVNSCTSNVGEANYQKYGNNGYAWCDRFVVWSLTKAGVPSSITNQLTSSYAMRTWGENEKRWYTEASKRQTGDLVKYNGHIGIIYKEGSTWKVIHGNWDHKVSIDNVNLNSKTLEGYISMKGITY